MSSVGIEEAIEADENEPAILVPLLSFGDSWFGSYEGQAQCVTFESEDGVRFIFQDALKQLTVDILLHKGLQVNMTTSRKDIKLKKPAILSIPKAMLPNEVQLTLASGMPIDYVVHEDMVEIRITQSGKILFK